MKSPARSNRHDGKRGKLGRALLWIAAPLLGFLTAGGIFWFWIMPVCDPVSADAFASRQPARIYYDRMDFPVHTDRGDAHQIRIPVKLDDLPKHLIDVTLAAEDRRFYDHDGVDVPAVFRAAGQLIRHGRIVSGASTITMQLVEMEHESAIKDRSFVRKFHQMARARNLERTHSKAEILEMYFNFLPYGGKIYGIEAAARYYFGRSAKDLNSAEAILLSGLPQAPARLRPDRHPDAAHQRFLRIVGMLEKQGRFTAEEASEIRTEPLRYRDFSLSFPPTSKDPLYFREARKYAPDSAWEIHTGYDAAMTGAALRILQGSLPPDGSVGDAAMVVIENRTGVIPVMIGTLDFSESKRGQVNAATAGRTPGSLFKPFIFAEALSAGLLVPETLLDDLPITDSAYRPGNSDAVFRGRISAAEALADSRNTPAVRVLRATGVPRVVRKLKQLHLVPPDLDGQTIGLALALGGTDSNLLALARAYSALAGNRYADTPGFIASRNASPPGAFFSPWPDGVPEMVLAMLRRNRLPGADTVKAAFKTGTSNNNCDAWCVALTPRYTVAVWFGNKSGAASPHLTGIGLAAPAAGRMISLLSPPDTVWPENPHTAARLLCAKTGLAAGEFCRETKPGTVLKEIPLRTCAECRRAAAEPAAKPGPSYVRLQVVSPAPGKYRARDRKAEFVLSCSPENVHLYVNGVYQGVKRSGSDLTLPPGVHQLFFWGGEGFGSTDFIVSVLPE